MRVGGGGVGSWWNRCADTCGGMGVNFWRLKMRKP